MAEGIRQLLYYRRPPDLAHDSSESAAFGCRRKGLLFCFFARHALSSHVRVQAVRVDLAAYGGGRSESTAQQGCTKGTSLAGVLDRK